MKHVILGLLGLPLVVSFAVVENGCNQHVVVGVGGSGGGDCPGIHGPAMARIPAPDGGSYCIDTTEVTQAQYDEFLQSSPRADTSSALCSYKTTFVPGDEPRDEQELAPWECRPDNHHFDPEGTPDLPVVCVDWCDAAAYCAWAGKRLCGRIGGGAGTIAPGSADEDEWYRACSNAGASPYPYGSTYEAGTCNDGSSPQPVRSAPDCHGTGAPFDEIFDMSGNVDEWENNCYPTPAGGGGGGGHGGNLPYSAFCVIRGGAAGDTGTPRYGCNGEALAQDPSNFQRPTTGIRCCAD